MGATPISGMQSGTAPSEGEPIGFVLQSVRRGDQRPQEFLFADLPAEGITLGREGDYVVGAEPGSCVSRHHATITYDHRQRQCMLADTSKNGTAIESSSGAALYVGPNPVPLSTNDAIYLGARVDNGGVVPKEGGAIVRFTTLFSQQGQ